LPEADAGEAVWAHIDVRLPRMKFDPPEEVGYKALALPLRLKSPTANFHRAELGRAFDFLFNFRLRSLL
jgi:hypothetical protein